MVETDNLATAGQAAPVTARATLTDDLLAVAAASWGLGPTPDRASVVDMGGTYNLNLRLRADHGDVVLRVYRPWVTAGRLAAVQSLRHALRVEGVPVVVPIARPGGATAAHWQGRLVEIEPWVASDTGADTWARYVAAGELLGSLHAAFRRVCLPVPFVGPPVSNVIDQQTFAEWLGQTRLAVTAAPLDPRALSALATCDEAERLRALALASPRAERTVHLTHGDFAHDNVRFRGDTPVAILDFDFVDVRDRLTDLAYTTYWMFEHLQWDVPPAERDWWQAGELVRRYEAASGLPLTPEELAAMPLAMAVIPTTWVAESWLMGDALHAIGLVARQMETVTWLIEHRDDLVRLWS